MNPEPPYSEAIDVHHGVLVNIFGKGVLFIGEPGIGKSSLALECLHQGHSLIADDCIEFRCSGSQTVIGHCPPMLTNLLHTRELGLIVVSEIFSVNAWQATIQLDYIVRLQRGCTFASELKLKQECYSVCDQTFPMLTLDIATPASVLNRVVTWMKMQASHTVAGDTLILRQQEQMKG